LYADLATMYCATACSLFVVSMLNNVRLCGPSHVCVLYTVHCNCFCLRVRSKTVFTVRLCNPILYYQSFLCEKKKTFFFGYIYNVLLYWRCGYLTPVVFCVFLMFSIQAETCRLFYLLVRVSCD